MNYRILSPDTVDAMIPLIQRVASELGEAYEAASERLESAMNAPEGAELAELLDRVQTCVTEMESLGGVLRSYEPVRVDFIAEVDGEIGYICWESGDREAAHFHAAMDGCGRPVLSS